MVLSSFHCLRQLGKRMPSQTDHIGAIRKIPGFASTRMLASSAIGQRTFGTVIIVVLWQFLSGVGGNAYYISSPGDVSWQIWDWIVSGFIWPHLLSTLINTAFGFLLAAVIAVALAVLITGSRFWDKVFSPLLFLAYSTPKIVLAPVLILWVGVGRPPVVLLSFISGFFIIFFNVQSGLRNVPRAYTDTAAILGANAFDTAFKFRLPAATSYIAAGLHQGLIYAFHGVILGEMTSSNRGIGYVIIYSATSMDSTAVIAGLSVLGFLSYILIRLLHGGVALGGSSDNLGLVG